MPFDYPKRSLILTRTTDENGVVSETATDKLGRTLYTTQALGTSEEASTHYVYDRFGRVKYVIQPEGWEIAKTSGLNGTVLDNLTFQYVYDERGRVIEKKVPGSGWTYLVYNKLDQVVFTQPAHMRFDNKWLFTKYDKLGRPIITGVNFNLGSRAHLQDVVNQSQPYESNRDNTGNVNGFTGYTNYAFPSTNTIYTEIHSITYYDDYDVNGDGTVDASYITDPDFPDHVVSDRTTGMVTAIRLKVLDAGQGMPDWLWTYTFYDEKGREIQTQADHHQGYTDVSYYAYNFAGELLFSKTVHQTYNVNDLSIHTYIPYEGSATVRKAFTYDHRGRLLRTEEKLEDHQHAGSETDFITLSEAKFNLIGQNTRKDLHYAGGEAFLQEVDYTYNIRGWLSSINNPVDGVSLTEDLFAMNLHYNTGNSAYSGTSDQFNGNISAMEWQAVHQGGNVQMYSFSYDGLNRLTQADYKEDTGPGFTHAGRYRIPEITYDLNGNIKTLKRRGRIGPNSYGMLDNLLYSYEDNGESNRLRKVREFTNVPAANNPEQFIEGANLANEYTYDESGNLTSDANADITSIAYNHLHKPTLITFGSGDQIAYIYSADGTKLRQNVLNTGGTVIKSSDYIHGFHYEDQDGTGTQPALLAFAQHEEGQVRRSGSEMIYEMAIRDHLGNVRVLFADLDNDGSIDTSPPGGEPGEVLQVEHYYPFGLRMQRENMVISSNESQYLYNGKERQDELGLNWYDYGARMYNPAVGRWNGVDALAEEFHSWSPYNYVMNNPVIYIDPDGRKAVNGHA
ncbi:MAG: RHS repeat-associated core domain-containing protein, partial [Bacteroidota bacterium]